MTDALVLDVPVEFGLELMAIVGSDFADAERELVDDVIDEVDGIGLVMALVDLEGPTRVASSMAVYWKRLIFCPCFPLKVRNLTSIWM